MVDEGPSQWDDFLHNGEGISNEIYAWKKEQDLSSAERAKIEAKRKQESEKDKRLKRMIAHNLQKLEERKKKDSIESKPDDLHEMVTAIDKYVRETKHLCFTSEEEYLLSILPKPKAEPDYYRPQDKQFEEAENSGDRFYWLLNKHWEWRKKQKLKTV